MIAVVTMIWIADREQPAPPALIITSPSALRVSDSGRYLVREDGTPVFWMADTAWQLIHDLSREEVEHYLQDRVAKGFNVIQTVALAERGGVESFNAHGHPPLRGRNVARPEVGGTENYWTHVDFVIQRAAHHGIYVALLPTWGSHVTRNYSNGKVNGLFNPEKAETYGRFLGERYGKASNVVWVLGGDRASPTEASKNIWRLMAKGIALGATGGVDQSRLLMTYHPSGQRSSSTFFPNDEWVDFNGIQSSHGPAIPTWKQVADDYLRQPPKPVIDLETTYEEIIFGGSRVPITTDMVRRAAYSAVFAGACGHTYGHNSIWQFCDGKRGRSYGARLHWKKALQAPGAVQMGHLRRFMEARSFQSLSPDPTLLVAEQPDTAARTLALSGKEGALVYFPMGKAQEIRFGRAPGSQVKAAWFDPRTGLIQPIGQFQGTDLRTFDPPGEEAPCNDWVLALDWTA